MRLLIDVFEISIFKSVDIESNLNKSAPYPLALVIRDIVEVRQQVFGSFGQEIIFRDSIYFHLPRCYYLIRNWFVIEVSDLVAYPLFFRDDAKLKSTSGFREVRLVRK